MIDYLYGLDYQVGGDKADGAAPSTTTDANDDADISRSNRGSYFKATPSQRMLEAWVEYPEEDQSRDDLFTSWGTSSTKKKDKKKQLKKASAARALDLDRPPPREPEPEPEPAPARDPVDRDASPLEPDHATANEEVLVDGPSSRKFESCESGRNSALEPARAPADADAPPVEPDRATTADRIPVDDPLSKPLRSWRDPPPSPDPTTLLTHAHMYALADRCCIPGLQRLSRAKFAAANAPSFQCVEAAERERGLRAAVVEALAEHAELLNKGAVQEALRKVDGLACDFLRNRWVAEGGVWPGGGGAADGVEMVEARARGGQPGAFRIERWGS